MADLHSEEDGEVVNQGIKFEMEEVLNEGIKFEIEEEYGENVVVVKEEELKVDIKEEYGESELRTSWGTLSDRHRSRIRAS